MNDRRAIAHFSMEIGLESAMPTYSGGLGVLAGDTIRSAADLQVEMVAVSLLHRKGYFHQKLDASGWQTEEPVEWVIEDFLQEMSVPNSSAPARVSVTLEGRTVQLRAWRYEVKGITGFAVPVYLLDAALPENSEWDRTLTDYLYGGDQYYRLCQEIILGIGGVRMLRVLGYDTIERFHMNEGHAALLTLDLLDEEARRAGHKSITQDDIESVKQKCVFTTHTPVPAGHDQFPIELVRRVLGPREDFFDMKNVYVADLLHHVLRSRQDFAEMKDMFRPENALNITYLALNLSHYINGVAKKHGEVSRLMFAEYSIDAITNGVHAATWVAKPVQDVYDRHIPGWRQDNFSLRYALSIPNVEMWEAHMQAKRELLAYLNHEVNVGMEVNVFTIGYARRAATYKRADLLFTDIERLKHIATNVGPLQLVYGGKAHPRDIEGKEIIKQIFQMKEILKNDIKVAYLENYDMDLGRLMTSGVDLWLNTPRPPLEASGTSGMKAALNGVPSLSILDGWWIEGCMEGLTGWSIGEAEGGKDEPRDRTNDVASLYDKLERVIIPMFYFDRDRFLSVMRHAIALNGSFFNTQRMVQQYVLNAYFR